MSEIRERLKADLANAIGFNQLFFRNLKPVEGEENVFEHTNGDRFEITENDGKKRMTRIISEGERNHIEATSPPAPEE